MIIRDYDRYDAEEILPLYAAVGWTNYTDRPDMLRQAFARALMALAAYEDGAPVGVLRAVGDGCSVVLIQDILVRPEYQRQGIGTALMREALRRCEGVYQVQLMTDDMPGTVAFYRSLGFLDAAALGCRAFMRG